MGNLEAAEKIILALDLDDRNQLEDIVDRLDNKLRWVKIGLQLFTKYGPEVVHHFSNKGVKIFLDLKLYDIPNTVAVAVQSISKLPVDLLTIHCSGGYEMMSRAVESANQHNSNLEILGVTVLTSMNDNNMAELNIQHNAAEQVEQLALLAQKANVQGLVCSPLEVQNLRRKLGNNIKLVTPGVRPAGSDAQEQKRVATPSDALKNGSSHLVIGRPILKADDPVQAFENIIQEITS